LAALTALNALGKRLKLDVRGDYSYSPWYSNIRVVAKLSGRTPDQAKTRDFNISPLGNHDYFMAEDLKAEPYARFSGQGGEFVFCASENPRLQGLAMWRGKYHEIAFYVPPAFAKDSSFGLSWFDGVSFEDEPDGLVVSASESKVVADSLDVSVANTGYLYVHSAQSGLTFVPEHSGARVGRGEVWNQLGHDGAPESLVYAAPSAVAVGSFSSARGATRKAKGDRMLKFFGNVAELEYEV